MPAGLISACRVSNQSSLDCSSRPGISWTTWTRGCWLTVQLLLMQGGGVLDRVRLLRYVVRRQMRAGEILPLCRFQVCYFSMIVAPRLFSRTQ